MNLMAENKKCEDCKYYDTVRSSEDWIICLNTDFVAIQRRVLFGEDCQGYEERKEKQ